MEGEMADITSGISIEKMRARKKELGYTYKELSELAGVSLPTVQKILGGFTKSPRYDNILALEKALWPDGMPAEPSSSRDGSSGTAFSYRSLQEDPFTEGFVAETPAALHYTDSGNSDGTRRVSDRSGVRRRSGRPTADSYPLLPHKQQGEYTAEDRELLPGDIRTELIDGVIYDLAAPKAIHQIVVGEIFNQIYNQIGKCGKDCLVFTAPSDVWLTGDNKNIFQPDIYVICDPDMLDADGWTTGAPPFIVEVLSPSTRSRDLLLKAYKYHRAGVHEYWIVDPEKKRILVYNYDKDPDGTVNTAYSFDDIVPIGFSGGTCMVDFSRAAAILRRLGW